MGKTKKCLNCSEYSNCKDSKISWIFFIIGLIATIAMRVVTVLMHLDPLYGKFAWYVGVFGFFLFFVYKFKVSHARSIKIKQEDLLNKVSNKERLETKDYDVIGSLLCSIDSKKEKINYFFIFGLSALTLFIAIYIDFFK